MGRLHSGLLAVALACSACSDSTPSPAASSAGDSAADGADTSESSADGAGETTGGTTGGEMTTGATVPPETGTVEGVHLAGSVIGPGGVAAPGMRVLLCSLGCRFTDTDEEGLFSYDDVEADHYALHFIDADLERHWLGPLFMFDVADDDVELALPVPVAPGAEPIVVTGAVQEVEVAPGVWFTVDPDAMSLPLGIDQLELSVAAPDAPVPELPDSEVLAVWYIEPFDAKSDPPVTLRATNVWDLEPGEELVLIAADFATYDWTAAGAVVVSEDGAELVGGAIPVFTTLILARP